MKSLLRRKILRHDSSPSISNVAIHFVGAWRFFTYAITIRAVRRCYLTCQLKSRTEGPKLLYTVA